MEQWSSRAGFILAAIGSAVGIGNIWRFSAVVGQNGGGAYLVPYLIAVFLCALPLMVLELAIGRHFHGTVVSAFRLVRPQFQVLGWLLCGIVFLMLSYYLVITGWTLGYALTSLAGGSVPFSDFSAGWSPVLLFAIAAAITGIVVSLGIRKGIERISTVLIPVSVGILVVLLLYATTMPGFFQGVSFFLTPDFSVLGDPLLWSAAFGQAFFSLSVGTGILLTYGAYVRPGEGIPGAALLITLADVGVALLAGLVIFPFVFSFGLVPTIGAELAFTTLPAAFDLIPNGWIVAAAFFLVLFFAALTSSISMLEVGVAAVQESLDWSRGRATAFLTGGILLIGLPSALSYSAVDLRIGGIRVLDFMDETVGALGLPVAAILIAVVFTWFMPPRMLTEEIGHSVARFVHPLCRFVIPGVLMVTTGARLLSGLDDPGLRNLPGSAFIGTVLQVEGLVAIVLIVLVITLILCRFRGCPLAGWIRGQK
ncbi:MAG TPA: sodium-dependent transporter [Methanofollis liminatans]|uniref:Sodium-dependent transporter n=1 Tax=Methanofollis liminatans TaxID=2201 RepID=A0A831PTU8_9EURY|nr:sodium-dependent transporter [Methanofollis liminatans]